ncbi:hypothetical protein SCLCIDRAFT_797416, partial [Scleroderma citrinum Foug A]
MDTISSTCLQPFKTFSTVVSALANIHPYAQMALWVLTSAAQVIINQATLDSSVSSLFFKVKSVYEFLLEGDTLANLAAMEDPLARISRVISNCTQFIKNYSETKNFWKRLRKNVMSETQIAVADYNNALEELMQQYRDRAVRDIHVNVYRVLEDLNLDGMTYAADVGLKTTKKCLEGTRKEMLKEIVDWIHDPDVNASRIMWLHGQAGKGKSAIAHTIAMWSKNVGELGSCFCFARDRQTERLENKMLSTIARDLANHDPTFRRVLARAIEDDNTLRTTTDVMQQWERLLLGPLSKVSGGMVGNVVLVIDALDESGADSSRKDILSVLTSSEAASLPSNFRILLTSRSLSDVMTALCSVQHVKVVSLDDVPVTFAERDIRLYVSKEVKGFRGIGEREIEDITLKADGLFEWARLAWEGETLLDSTYRAILEGAVGRKPKALTRFRSMMQQILCTLQPLPMGALHTMRLCFTHEHDRFDVAIILDYMGSLLSGVTDHTNPIRPLHASFYDFLTDCTRSEDYFVGKLDIQTDLAIASLRILDHGLYFNICELESSYLLNSEVLDLAERVKAKISPHLSYSCCFWAKHLQATKFDPVLARHVKDLVGSEKMMFWFEAMSLLGTLGNAAIALSCAVGWLQVKEYEDARALARDGMKFIHNFCIAPTASTPHLYMSALAFTPQNSVLYRTLKPKFPWIARVAEGHYQDWPAAQILFQGHTDWVTSVAFSPDGTRIVSGSGDETVRVW